MASTGDPAIVRALAMLPAGHFVLTAAFETKRSGMIVRWVQPCADEPLLVSVAARRGHSIEPLIRDSHAFALCRVDPEDKLVARKFAIHRPPDDTGDPFDSVPVETMVTGSPVLRRSQLVLDCEVVRHFDLEADHELFIGLVRAGRVGPGVGA
jgi:flavin reductase (DIM6/NTAB) family NADH-FMN oxidoreductase RutF